MKSSKRFVILHVLGLNLLALSLLNFSGCTSMHISDTPLMIQLPASKKCLEIKVMSWSEMVYSPEQCEKIKERSIILTSEAWKMLKTDIEKNCQLSQCKQISGAADSLFQIIDDSLNKIPGAF